MNQLVKVLSGKNITEIRTAHPIVTKLIYDKLYPIEGFTGDEMVFYHPLRICEEYGLLRPKLAANSKAYMIYQDSDDNEIYISKFNKDMLDNTDIMGMISVDYNKPFNIMMSEINTPKKIYIRYATSLDSITINIL